MYEDILINLRPAIPTTPGVYLWRGNLAARTSPCGGFPFVFQRVRRRWWLFGEVGFKTAYRFTPASHWTAEHWRVPAYD